MSFEVFDSSQKSPSRLSSSQGQVYWITGLAGAGKTTLAKCLYHCLKRQKKNIVFLDGDALREVFDERLSYELKDRLKLSMKYGKLCRLFASQGLDVICATISMFDACREWNRSHLTNYFEIYIRVPLNILKKRDQKKLYSQSLKGKTTNVMGLDVPFEEPKKPDLIIENNGQKNPQELCEEVLKVLCIKRP